MRTILTIAAIVIVSLGGCAGTRDAQRPAPEVGNSPHATPVVPEQPTLSDRLRYNRQQDANQVGLARTEVRGNVSR